jgi:DNA polymerase-3 subunit gamma/tau
VAEAPSPSDAPVAQSEPATLTAGEGSGPAGEVPYQSLYRRYRPQRFDEVRGQDHVTRALRNAVRDSKVAHAYLFSGPRGTGKTSTARILAMALNCEHPVDGEPDGICSSCVEIRRGASLDVHELDAASNRKLDEMRDLLSRVALGTRGRWKVYIVDEVHQLTPDAASALLKTLEEPPSHVVFVLATTDPQKVLPTIRSRTQHFEFRLLGADVLGQLLSDVNERAALGLTAETIDHVVRRGHGSARDALSVLDQVAAAGDVADEGGPVGDIVEALVRRDPGGVLTGVAAAVAAGRDPRRLTVDLLEHLRNGFLATQAPALVLLPRDAAAEVEEQARRMGLAAVVKGLEGLGQAGVDMRDAIDPRVTLEAALVRLAAPALDGSSAALIERIERLERQVDRLMASAPGPRAPSETEVPPHRGDPVAPVAPVAPPSAALRSTSPPSAAPAAPAGASSERQGDGVGVAAARSRLGGPDIPEREPRGQDPARPVSGVRAVGAAPPMPARRTPSATGPAAPSAPPTGRPALGMHLRGPQGDPGGPRPDARPRPEPSGVAGARGAGSPPSRSAPPARSGPPPARSGPARFAGTAPPAGAESPTAKAPASSATGPPTRDELTKAWGDHVLPTLSPALRAYLSTGRFLADNGATAIYAVADHGLLARALPMQLEIQTALASYFRRPVAVSLVVDGESAPVQAAGGPVDEPEDESVWDVEHLEDAGPGVISPEQRLLEAFPGAEEVTP